MWTKAAPTSSETDASRPAAVSFTYFASSGSASQRSTSVIAAALSTRFGSTLRTNALTADESRMSRRCQSIRLSSGAWRPRWVAITSCPRRSASWPMYCPRRPVPPTSRTRATSSGWMRGPKPFRGERICSAAQYPESSMDLIQGVVVRPLKQIHDERGYLMEMLRTDWPEFERFAQSYITIGYPGIVKGWHYHKKQTDHFVVVRGTAKVVCYDNRDRSPTKGKVNEFFPGERNPMLIKIPPYVVHGFKAVGPEPVYLVNFPTELYDYKEPDEFRIPYDSKDIPYDWDVQMKRGRHGTPRRHGRHGFHRELLRTPPIGRRQGRSRRRGQAYLRRESEQPEGLQGRPEPDVRPGRCVRPKAHGPRHEVGGRPGSLRRGDPRRPVHPRGRRLRADGRDGDLVGSRGLSQERREAGLPYLDGRGVRRSCGPSLDGVGPAHAEKSLRRLEGRSGPTGLLLLRDVRFARRHLALHQQLRTVPAPGEADPVVRDERVGGHASAGLRDRSEYPGLGPRGGSLRRVGSPPEGRSGPG